MIYNDKIKFKIPNLSNGPFEARSASDKTDDWKYWFVANKNGLNILGGTGVGLLLQQKNMQKV